MNNYKEKYYAVKVGFKPGIYTSWIECKNNVNRYTGAQYKSFKTRLEAEEYLTGNKLKKATCIEKSLDVSKVLITDEIDKVSLKGFKTLNNNYYIFTDGSNKKTHCAYGVYFGNDLLYEISPTFIHYTSLIISGDKTNNIAELKAIQSAIHILINNADYINKNNKIIIITDSKYSINCITKWYIKWRKNGWLNSKNESVSNREIIEDIIKKIEHAKKQGFQIIFKHQLAHTSKPINKNGLLYYLWLGNYIVDYLVQKKVINK
jgi:ribonuclease HI